MARFNESKLKIGQFVSYYGGDGKIKYEAPIETLLSTQCRLRNDCMISYSDVLSSRNPENEEEFSYNIIHKEYTLTKKFKYSSGKWELLQKITTDN